MRILFVAFGMVGGTLLLTSLGQACSCLPPPLPLEAAGEADLVFAGKVVSIVEADSEDLFSPLIVELQTEEVFKGEEGAESIAVMTGSDGALCGFGFREGAAYLVYARRSRGKFWTGLCDRTTGREFAGEEVKVLRQLPKPLSLEIAMRVGELVLTVAGGSGRALRLERSVDLQEWTTVLSLSPSHSPFVLEDPLPADRPMQFFRIREAGP